MRFSLTDPTEPVPIDQLIKLQSAIRLFDTKYDDLNNRLSEYLSYPDYMQVRHCECRFVIFGFQNSLSSAARSAVDCFYQIDGYINDISSLLETFDSQKQVVELVADLVCSVLIARFAHRHSEPRYRTTDYNQPRGIADAYKNCPNTRKVAYKLNRTTCVMLVFFRLYVNFFQSTFCSAECFCKLV